jgi:predicted DNA-binding transcriptional regulator AlpA
MNEKEITERSSDGLLSKRALAPKLQISVRSVDDWMKRGWIPYIKIGPKTVRFRLQDVLEKLNARRVN